MPIYDFACPKCHVIWSDLRHTYDVTPPECGECKATMEQVFHPATIFWKGNGWSHGASFVS